jgi:hypothetical protein
MMNCLEWFNSLIANRESEDLKNDFKLFAKQQGGYFMPNHPSYDFNDESVFYIDLENDGNMVSSSYSFSLFMDNRIDEEYRKVILCISELKIEDQPNDYIISLKSQLDSLIYLNSTLNIQEKREKINTTLQNVLNYIRDHVSTTTQISESENQLIETVFGYLGKRTEIKDLYNSLEILGFFNPDINQYESFYKILTTPSSTKVVNLQTYIKVSCGNNSAAYILSKIEPLFSRLNFRSIDKSGLIKNRLDHPFTESGLSKAKSIFKAKAEIDDTLKNEIDRELSRFLNKR